MKFNLEVTFSKLLATIVLIGSIYATNITGDGNVFIAGVTAASAIAINKQYQDRVKAVKLPNNE
jgi:arginine exporter protein ArgO